MRVQWVAKSSVKSVVQEGKAGWRVRDGAGKAVEDEVADVPVRKRKKLELPCCSEKGTGCYI